MRKRINRKQKEKYIAPETECIQVMLEDGFLVASGQSVKTDGSFGIDDFGSTNITDLSSNTWN